MTRSLLSVVVLLLAAGAVGAVEPDAGALAERARPILGGLPVEASSEANPVTDAKIALGRMLYYDTRLSLSGKISCNTCHLLDHFGVDGTATSQGHEGQRGDRNAPTVYNAALHVAQFWDGRAPTVEEQAKGPVLNPIEMAMPNEQYVLDVLKSIPGYRPLFEQAFPGEAEPINYDNFGRAIGAFERRLLTPGRLDRFLGGDLGALAANEQRGLAAFVDTGCTSCHMGPAVGGRMFQRLGLVSPYETADTGRFKLTGVEADRFLFKVPSLRNVAETGPYFHDGKVETLEQAVRLMAHHQLGRELSEAEVADLVAFLRALTGSVDAAYVAPPELPR